jgi:hypothetical protein
VPGRLTVGRKEGVGASPAYSESEAFSCPGWKGVGEAIPAEETLFIAPPHPEINNEIHKNMAVVFRMR